MIKNNSVTVYPKKYYKYFNIFSLINKEYKNNNKKM